MHYFDLISASGLQFRLQILRKSIAPDDALKQKWRHSAHHGSRNKRRQNRRDERPSRADKFRATKEAIREEDVSGVQVPRFGCRRARSDGFAARRSGWWDYPRPPPAVSESTWCVGRWSALDTAISSRHHIRRRHSQAPRRFQFSLARHFAHHGRHAGTSALHQPGRADARRTGVIPDQRRATNQSRNAFPARALQRSLAGTNALPGDPDLAPGAAGGHLASRIPGPSARSRADGYASLRPAQPSAACRQVARTNARRAGSIQHQQCSAATISGTQPRPATKFWPAGQAPALPYLATMKGVQFPRMPPFEAVVGLTSE